MRNSKDYRETKISKLFDGEFVNLYPMGILNPTPILTQAEVFGELSDILRVEKSVISKHIADSFGPSNCVFLAAKSHKNRVESMKNIFTLP